MLLCWHWWTGACRLVPSRDDKSAGVRAHREHIGGAAVVVNGSGALSLGCARRWSPRRARRSTRSAAPPVTAAGGEQDETGGDQRAGGDQNPGRVAPGARQLRRRHDRGRADRDVSLAPELSGEPVSGTQPSGTARTYASGLRAPAATLPDVRAESSDGPIGQTHQPIRAAHGVNKGRVRPLGRRGGPRVKGVV